MRCRIDCMVGLVLMGTMGLFVPAGLSAGEQGGLPQGNEGTRIFRADEHPTYSGRFHIIGTQATLVGSMRDDPPWDHMDYEGQHLNAVNGSIEIEVNERTNTGLVLAEFTEGADHYRIVFDRFDGSAAYQSGGIATRVYEHGDSGQGDPLYPKTWLYLGGWGNADVLKNGEPLYQDYDAHFMVMERSRDPRSHTVLQPEEGVPGGATDPAGMEIDLWVRSKERNADNFPPFETFIHLYWEEVTWR